MVTVVRPAAETDEAVRADGAVEAEAVGSPAAPKVMAATPAAEIARRRPRLKPTL
jgi:hypothetical protein